MQLGAHVSAAGGLDKTVERAETIGCDCIQVFTRNQRTWQPKPITEEEAAAFHAARAGRELGAVMSHGSYLVNPSSPDAEKHAKSYAAMEAELDRCHRFGIGLYNFHPGAHMEKGTDWALRRTAETLNRLCAEHPEQGDVRLVLENVAGQGTTIGRTFEELAGIFEHLEQPQRFGVCVDTAHAFAAGYELSDEDGWERTWRDFDRALGLERLVAIHLNDSKAPFDSRKDRHALVGRGEIGPRMFEWILTDPRTRDVPMFLETPGGPEGWKLELRWLRAVAAGERPPLPEIEEAGPAL
ncbi:MAG TPA: deoxyribonuclease IV [Gammaproteobacteria bacterium]|nr:deoxyribonuclease IV [Gammaproteobacteria bacterium]